MTPGVYLVIALVCGIVGSLIGRPKGFPILGFIAGALLGLILWPTLTR